MEKLLLKSCEESNLADGRKRFDYGTYQKGESKVTKKEEERQRVTGN